MMLTLLEKADTVSMSTTKPAPQSKIHSQWPGLLVILSIAVLASTLASALSALPPPMGPVPISAMLIAIVAGITLGPAIRKRDRLSEGVALAKGPLLKIAVALVGLRLSLSDLLVAGAEALPIVVAMIVLGLSIVLFLGRLLGVSPRLTILLAAGTSICGASAIMATSPAIKAHHEETCYAVACIGVLGLIGTVIYPLILEHFIADPQLIGVAIGTVIHDTAQVMAAAIYHQQLWPNEQTLDAATVAKLMRNSTMLIVIPLLVTFYYRWDRRASPSESNQVAFPLFILVFVALSFVRTIGDGWLGATPDTAMAEIWASFLKSAHRASLVGFSMAMAALASTVSVGELKALGIRGFWVGALASSAMLLVVILWLS